MVMLFPLLGLCDIKCIVCFLFLINLSNVIFWCNFNIEGFKGKLDKVGRFGEVKSSKTGRTDEKDKLIRNCVEPEIGLHILNCILKNKEVKQEAMQSEARHSSQA